MMDATQLAPHDAMMKLILGKWISKPVYLAARLKLADRLVDGPLSIEDLAVQTGTHAPSLYRMMRALASVGIFSEMEDGRFDLTPMAACLQSDRLGPVALMMQSEWHDHAWNGLLCSIQTGQSAFEKRHGKPVSAWLKDHPEAQEVVARANAVKAAGAHAAVLAGYDFSGITTLVDVGGGNAALMLEILKRTPSLTGVVADLPAMIPGARANIRKQGLESRCETVGLDFFEAIPAVGDTHMLSNILHNWDDAACETILHNICDVMEPGARLLIVEMVLPDGNEFSIAKLMDLEMLVMGQGRERTAAEYQTLLASVGLKNVRFVAGEETVSIIEATRSQKP